MVLPETVKYWVFEFDIVLGTLNLLEWQRHPRKFSERKPCSLFSETLFSQKETKLD
jgi:hypothetical protein